MPAAGRFTSVLDVQIIEPSHRRTPLVPRSDSAGLAKPAEPVAMAQDSVAPDHGPSPNTPAPPVHRRWSHAEVGQSCSSLGVSPTSPDPADPALTPAVVPANTTTPVAADNVGTSGVVPTPVGTGSEALTLLTPIGNKPASPTLLPPDDLLISPPNAPPPLDDAV
jgi:hypothetical protein